MKHLFILLSVVFLCTHSNGQAPQKMSYQAVIRNSAGTLLPNNTAVGMRVSILQQTPTGTAVYVETQAATTNENGLIDIQIGAGTPVTGSFSAINWATGPYFLKTESDPAGGANYSITGTSQLLSVPYALYSGSTGNAGFSNFQVFDATGLFTVPALAGKVMVELWGAGGGGGGGGGGGNAGNSNGATGGGGGGGSYCKNIFSVNPGDTFSVVVGAGGPGGGGGTASGNGIAGGTGGTGVDGGSSSVKTNFAFGGHGGNGGDGGPSTSGSANGGNGGGAGQAGGSLNFTGGVGFNGNIGGYGGSGAAGGGAGGVTGNNAAIPGGGGMAAYGSNGAGATAYNGAGGRVIVWW